MILLTGATGVVGSALLRRLVAADIPVRCLVRDPRRLGAERVRVQLALGDLGDPRSFRNALRGVETVVHLAAAIRDQPRATIEELNGLATYRLVRAAEQAGVERFAFFSALGATEHSSSRFFRAKALAERAVGRAEMETLVFAPSIVYAPGDPWMRILRRLSWLPVMPVAGAGRAEYQPIWAEDAAACVLAALGAGGPAPEAPSARDGAAGRRRWELAGPQVLTHDQIVALAVRSFGRRRRRVHVPLSVVRAGLRVLERLAGSTAFATWEEAELLEIPMTTPRGPTDAEALGVSPAPLPEVLGSG